MNRDEATRLAEDLYSKPRPLTPQETDQLVDFLLHGLGDTIQEVDNVAPELPIEISVAGVRLVIDELDEGEYGIRHDPPKNAGDGLAREMTVDFHGWPIKVEICDGEGP